MITANAKDYMSEEIIEEVVRVLKPHSVLRITFYPPGADPTATECTLDSDLLRRCRAELKDDAPIRLYFSRRTRSQEGSNFHSKMKSYNWCSVAMILS